MLNLRARLGQSWSGSPFIARVEEAHAAPPTRGVVRSAAGVSLRDGDVAIALEPELDYLDVGDVVRVIPQTGELSSLYRRSSPHNAIFVTGRCNSRCVMCSQPPIKHEDNFLIEVWREAIPLMDKATRELGFTGGEPTLLREEFLELVRTCLIHLPDTALHVLSNGRLFNYLRFAQALGDIRHPDLMLGIPLYSDLAHVHNFVVQAEDAFDQTLRGIMNLKRCGVRVELRVVLHQATARRLPQLARFITRNLPYVEHVALMGFEQMGFGKLNREELWLDPVDYRDELTAAVEILDAARLRVSLYNHQLCTLPRGLWPYARRSISDWKNEYVSACETCSVKQECGGFFASSTLHTSRGIHPIAADAP